MGLARATERKLRRAIEGVIEEMQEQIGPRLEGEEAKLDQARRDIALCGDLIWRVESIVRDRKLLEHLEVYQAMELAYQYTLTITMDSISLSDPVKRAEPSLCSQVYRKA